MLRKIRIEINKEFPNLFVTFARMDSKIEDLIVDVELEIESYQYDLHINFDLEYIESGLPFFEELEEDIVNRLEAIMYLTKSYVIFDILCNKFNLSLFGTRELLFFINNEEDGIFFNHINLRLPIEWRASTSSLKLYIS